VVAKTDHGLVTLTGTVAFHHQRAEAEFICANVRRVVEINDEVALGTVTSCAEHDEATTVAWSPPGVTDVDDRVIVAY
jgi:osmotically-inducible protein OsmY